MLRENHGTYETTLTYALRELGRMINPDRLYILEFYNGEVHCDFEWDAPGISVRKPELQAMSYQELADHYSQLLMDKHLINIEDIEELRSRDEAKYGIMKKQGIQNLIAVPFYYRGRRQGLLIAENYARNEEINTKDLLETAAYFFAAEIQAGRLIKEMNYINQYDRLTNVHNRNAMEQRIDKFENEPESVGVIYADINGLKQRNDEYGHEAGDAMIKQAAALMKETFEAEQIYRIGGDEFVIFVNSCTEEDFQVLVHEFNKKNQACQTILLMGMEWIMNSKQIRACMKRVDTLMYENKRLFYETHQRYSRK